VFLNSIVQLSSPLSESLLRCLEYCNNDPTNRKAHRVIDPLVIKGGSTGGDSMAARIGKGKKISAKHVSKQDLSMNVCKDMFAFSFPCYPKEIVNYLSNYFPMDDVDEC
jgi:hypothetical protein